MFNVFDQDVISLEKEHDLFIYQCYVIIYVIAQNFRVQISTYH